MPLTPSSYKKIFKSKYVQDDSDEEVAVDDDTDDLDYKPSTSSVTTSIPSYTPSTTSSTYTAKKIPMLTSAYLDSHPELNYNTSAGSSYNSSLSSNYLDSLSSKNTTSFSYPRSTTSSYAQGQNYTSSYDSRSSLATDKSFLTPERSISSKLPPLPPRITPQRRNFDESAPFSSDSVSSRFQSRPLRNLTVVSRSTTPVHSVNRSPSPVDSLSWRSNKSTTPVPRRVYPQTSATVDLDDLVGKEEAPVVFDANLTFVLGCKGKLKQNVTPIPAHTEKDTASSCLTDKIQDFLKRTDHVMEEWKSTGRRRDDNNNMSVKERALMGRSKSATNIMIKGFQLFSRANSCSRSSIGKDLTEDLTEAEVDEVLTRSDNIPPPAASPCMLPAN
ncbi:Myo18 [Trypoxylus dichotomus]